MGSNESKEMKRKKEFQTSRNDIKEEVIISPEGFHSLDESITQTAKSLCKIMGSFNRISSGFLIQLFKGEKEFYCLVTNEHVITKKMIEQKIEINIFYDSQSKFKKIKLNPEERLIKEFRDIQMDVTVIEIIPKDEISKDFFYYLLLIIWIIIIN